MDISIDTTGPAGSQSPPVDWNASLAKFVAARVQQATPFLLERKLGAKYDQLNAERTTETPRDSLADTNDALRSMRATLEQLAAAQSYPVIGP